ncbi:hypothetical protein EGW08_015833 [Elysia chlorotica]|uniref:Transmembrane protein 186 n=1 Tax=Elysia chlorotica TaxID=188477 RepID=A0A433T490_ELYCH|nr:hypothetical protein EGW08_015833 [Elysia chlorotica]
MNTVICHLRRGISPVLGTLRLQPFRVPLKACSFQHSIDGIGNRCIHRRQIFTLRKTLHFRPQYNKDGVPKTYLLVYENSQGALLSISRVLSTAGGLSGAGVAMWYLIDRWEQLQPWQLYALSGAFLLCVAAVTSVNIIARFYLMRIYMNEPKGKFIGIHQSFLGRLGQIHYSVKDVQPPVRGKGKPIHSKATVKVKDRNFHIRASDFIIPKYYNAHLKIL